jgi:hypothetical protein
MKPEKFLLYVTIIRLFGLCVSGSEKSYSQRRISGWHFWNKWGTGHVVLKGR